MINNLYSLRDEKIHEEIQTLLKEVDKVKDKINIYCDMMKQIYLSGSSKN